MVCAGLLHRPGMAQLSQFRPAARGGRRTEVANSKQQEGLRRWIAATARLALLGALGRGAFLK